MSSNPEHFTANISLEILEKILLYAAPEIIDKLPPSSRAAKCIQNSSLVLNSLCSTTGLTPSECKALIKSRKALAAGLEKAPQSVAHFKTEQVDLTMLVVHDGLIYSASEDRTVCCFTLAGKLVRKLEGHNGGVWALDVTNSIAVSGSTDRTARVWDLVGFGSSIVLRGHRSTVRVVKARGKYIITGSRDSTVGVWNASGTQLGILSGHTEGVRAMDLDDSYLVTGSYDGTVKLWNYKSGIFLGDIFTFNRRVYAVKLHRRYVAAAGLDAVLKVAEIDGRNETSHSVHRSVIAWIDFSGNYVISSGSDGIVVKFNYISNKVAYFIQAGGPVRCQKIYHNVLFIATMKMVDAYDLQTGRFIRTIFSADMIYGLEIYNSNIIVGYLHEGGMYISVLTY